MQNAYALSDTTPDTVLDSGEVYELTGKMFSNLPEELQDRITDFLLNVYYFESISEDEVTELFFRINNGKPLSPIELTRVRAVSMKQIHEAAKHDIFTVALTAKALERYTNEDIVIKTWAMLNTDSPSLSTRDIRPLMESVTFTDEQILEMFDVYDRMLTVHKLISDTSKRTAKKMFTRTHLLALTPVIRQSIADNISIQDVAEWIKAFYSGTNGASVSEVYNETTSARTTNRENVQKRHDAIMEHYTQTFYKE
jgi:hypothetical protein